MERHTSTLPALTTSYATQGGESTSLVARQVRMNRKSWKTGRANNELVWSPSVEAAMIEGLEKYRPKSKTKMENLKRFPGRNKFIAGYIFKTTQQTRTSKQVSSRLQQLKNCKSERILKLLSRREYTPEPETKPDTCGSDTKESASTPLTPSLSCSSCMRSATEGASDVKYAGKETRRGDLDDIPLTHTTVRIELTPQCNLLHPEPSYSGQSSHSDRKPSSEDTGSRSCSESIPRLPIIDTSLFEITVPNFDFLPDQPPTVRLKSTVDISTSEFLSYFSIYLWGNPVFTEVTDMSLESSSFHYSTPTADVLQFSHFYVTKLVPQYWQKLCQFKPDDLFQCSIVQQIARWDPAQKDATESAREIKHSVKYWFISSASGVSCTIAPTQAPIVVKEESSADISTCQIDDRVHAPSVPEGSQVMHPRTDGTSARQRVTRAVSSEGVPTIPSIRHRFVQTNVYPSYPTQNNPTLPVLTEIPQQQKVALVRSVNDAYPECHYTGNPSLPVIRRSHSPDSLGLDPPLREYSSSIPPLQLGHLPHDNGYQQQTYSYTLHPQTGVPSYFWRSSVPVPLVAGLGVDSTSYGSNNYHDQSQCNPCEFAQPSSFRQHQYSVGIYVPQGTCSVAAPLVRFSVPDSESPSYYYDTQSHVHQEEWASVPQPQAYYSLPSETTYFTTSSAI